MRVGEPGAFPSRPSWSRRWPTPASSSARSGGRAAARARRAAHASLGARDRQAPDAVIGLAASYEPAHALALADAAADYDRLGLAFDHARTLLSLGRASAA
jgi:hypothetical protein